MIAALSPAVSWALFLACVAVGITVYVVVAGGHRYRRIEREAEAWRRRIEMVPTAPVIRILGGVYDHKEHGDFDSTEPGGWENEPGDLGPLGSWRG